jgi:pimeloyl-ACP methyl ester carboxylesterase
VSAGDFPIKLIKIIDNSLADSDAGDMAVESEDLTELGDEFALIAEVAEETGAVGGTIPRVRRGWVNVPAGGHVSGVFWGDRHPEVVFLHDVGESARTWDAVALAIGRPSVAIDLPGHGRSDWRRDGRYEPGKLASAVAEAIRAFAPRVGLVVGSGLGGRTALVLRQRQPRLVPRLALLPVPVRAREWPGAEHFASRAEALAALALRRPEHSAQSLRREILYELIQDRDGSWSWRHHPGNLPAPPDGHAPPDDAAVIGEAAPDVEVISIPGGGADVVASQPAALAAALDGLLTTKTGEQR